jgi:hypothetical protein
MAAPSACLNRYLHVEQLRLPHVPQDDFDPEAAVALPDEPTPNSEKSRSDLRPPHRGHRTPRSFPTAQSLSNSFPHAPHLNSYIGIDNTHT